MRRTAGLWVVALAFSSLIWAGGPSWKNKHYQQWTYEDINSIFEDSPWSHLVTIERNWVPWVNKELPEAALGVGGRSMPGSLEQSSEEVRGAQVRFYISWMSSRVMREALARYAVLRFGKGPAEGAEPINQESDEYFVMVQGSDMTPFQQKSEEYYKTNAFLQTKKTKRKVFPNRVSYQTRPDGKSVNAVKFFFPKTTSGEPLFEPNEKNVQFGCRLGESLLQAAFSPREMADADSAAGNQPSLNGSEADKGAKPQINQTQDLNSGVGVVRDENELISLAESANQVGQYQKAEELLGKAIAADPSKWDLYRALAASQLKLNEDEKALASLQKGVELAQQAMGAHQLDRDKAAQLKAAIGQMLTSEGSTYVKLGRNVEGIAALQKAAEMEATPALAYFNLCVALYKSKEWKRAADACGKSIAADPTRAEAYFIKGSALAAATRRKDESTAVPSETTEALKKYLELAPNGTHAALAKALLEGTSVKSMPKP